MRIAFVLFDGMTLLDFAGMYDPVTRLRTMGFLPDLGYATCAQKSPVISSEGLRLLPDTIGCALSSYDYILIRVGDGIANLVKDRPFLDWINVRNERTVVAAVCGGALLAGAAGLLRDRKATTHPNLQGLLTKFAGDVVTERIVEDRRVITAGGVTAAIDLGLYLCERIAGPGVREKIQRQMDYPHYPAGI